MISTVRQAFKEIQLLHKQRSRKTFGSNERLKEFRKSTMHNAIFICISCHQRCFKSNVVEFSSTIKSRIDEKHPGIVETCIWLKCYEIYELEKWNFKRTVMNLQKNCKHL